MKIPVLRIDGGLPVPQKAHPGDGGVDLYAREDVLLSPGGRSLVPTGVAVAVPEGYAGLVTPRSGMAARRGISILNAPGLVDSGYRGELKVALVNLGEEAVAISRGDRVAQLMVVPIADPDFVEVDELPPSSRGSQGFGSTGT